MDRINSALLPRALRMRLLAAGEEVQAKGGMLSRFSVERRRGKGR